MLSACVALLRPCCKTCGECQEVERLPTITEAEAECLKVPPSWTIEVVVLSVEEIMKRSVRD